MIDAPNRVEDAMFRRKVSEDGKYEIGIHPVMFGYRVRASRVGEMWCDIDYCCQSDPKLIQLVYNCVQAIIKTRVARSEPVFDNFPVPENKLYNDPKTLSDLVLLMVGSVEYEPISVSVEELKSYREELFQNLGTTGV